MKSNPIDLTVIIASYNTRDLTLACIRSVIEHTHGIAYEVIVIDDCSPDDTCNSIREQYPQVRLLVNESNLRYAKTNNRGLMAAQGKYALLLNSDTELCNDAFTYLVRFMDANLGVAAAGPKLVNPDGSVQHCIRAFPGLSTMVFQTLNLHRIWPGNPITNRYYNEDFDYSRSQPVASIGTTAFILRRETWQHFGMLDERFTLAFVDLAYCRMLGLQGQIIQYVPEGVVKHYGSSSINQNGVKEINLQHEALLQFYELYYASGQTPAVRWLTRTGIRIRERLKVIEFRLSRDKRVIKGPGAPPNPGFPK